MILNAHSYYSLRYGTLNIEEMLDIAKANNHEVIALTDINNTTGVLDHVRLCRERGLTPIAGAEFRNGDELLFIAIARNNEGFREINELLTHYNLSNQPYPQRPDKIENCYIIYPYGKIKYTEVKEHEYIGVRLTHLNKILLEKKIVQQKYVILQGSTFKNRTGYEVHKKLRAIDCNLLLSQLEPQQIAGIDEYIIPKEKLLHYFEFFPHIIENTKRIISNCSFEFDFKAVKNLKYFTGDAYQDIELLKSKTLEGLEYRYSKDNKVAIARIEKELEIIHNKGFSSYFLMTWDMIRESMSKGIYHYGRGSGANSVVAYCLRITDVCPIELDLYFERFLNPKRQAPPDFDIDYSWKDRNSIYDYMFKKYGTKRTALLGAMVTFQDRSVIREMGKVYGLPKEEIDRLIKNPNSPLNNSEICQQIKSHYSSIANYPSIRSIHAGGILISELPLTYYTALDMPPKGYQTTQFDMHVAEDVGFEKLDILSQRGLGHIKEAGELVEKNRGIKIDTHQVEQFKSDEGARQQLLSGNTIGCFYVESPAMRGLLKKLKCDNYLTLVAASSIIRPGVAKSGMMKAYIERNHNPKGFQYLHPIMEKHLKETFGVMVYQEDVLKVAHYFGGLDLADADVLRRMMSGKSRSIGMLKEIRKKYDLPEKFLLHFGNTAPKKNTAGVLNAYNIYRSKVNVPLPLVITDCTADHISDLLQQLNAADIKEHIRILDYVPFDSIPCLYNLATVFLYPSHRESFGMPVIEAMACGVPVITSNTSALPEIAGDAGCLIHPEKPSEIAEKIIRLLSDEKFYKDRQEKGFINAARFSWKIAAEKTLSVYNEIQKTS